MANLANYKQFAKVFSPIFTAFIIELCMASCYPWRNIWPLIYGSIFPSSISTSSFRYCSYYRMYFYNELTITSNLCHDFNFSVILRLLHASTSYATTRCACNRLWLLSACKLSYVGIRGHVHVALAPFR